MAHSLRAANGCSARAPCWTPRRSPRCAPPDVRRSSPPSSNPATCRRISPPIGWRSALLSPLLARSRAATGRVNLLAETPGLLLVDAAKIDRLNSIDESLTIGTLPDHAVVAPKDLVATIKVIPFAVPGTVLTVAETIARQGGAALTLPPFRRLRVGLVVTELPGLKDSVTEKTIAATEARVTATDRRPAARRCTARTTRRRSPARSRR